MSVHLKHRQLRVRREMLCRHVPSKWRILAAALALPGWLLATPPVLKSINPIAVRPGAETTLALEVENVSGPATLWTSFPCTAMPLDLSAGQLATTRITVPRDPGSGFGIVRIVAASGISEPRLLAWDPLTGETAIGAPDPKTAPLLAAPSGVLGRFSELRADWYRVAAPRGKAVAVEIISGRLGSTADPFLEVWSPTRRRLAVIEDAPGAGVDARWRFEASTDEELLISVRDTGYAGGPEFRYWLRAAQEWWPGATNFVFQVASAPDGRAAIAEVEPNDEFGLATLVEAQPIRIRGRFERGGDRDYFRFRPAQMGLHAIRGFTRSLGSAANLRLRLMKSDGVEVATNAASAADEGLIETQLEAGQDYCLEVAELNHAGGVGFEYRVAVDPSAGFSAESGVGTFNAAPGTSFEVKLTLRAIKDPKARLRFRVEPGDWPIEPAEIAAGQKEATLKVRVPEAIRPGSPHLFRILGQVGPEAGAATMVVSTRPALRKLWPGILAAPEGCDGWFALGVVAPQ